jgi:hypothetical protein
MTYETATVKTVIIFRAVKIVTNFENCMPVNINKTWKG